MYRSILQLYLLAHPHSLAGQRLASGLMSRFMDPPATGGLRIPAFFTPDRNDGCPPRWSSADEINLDTSEHTIVFVISDHVMTRQYNDEAKATFEAWRSFFVEGIQRATASEGSHSVFAVSIDDNGFALADSENMLAARKPAPQRMEHEDEGHYSERIDSWVSENVDDIALELTIRAIQLFDPRVQGEEGKRAPVRFFLSHAKKNLSDHQDGPVRAVQRHVADLPIHYWFDAQDIPPSTQFAKEIESGIRDCSIVLAFLTDDFANSLWCTGEILDAKRLGIPILVVDALEAGEPRNLTCLGNLPTTHWSGRSSRVEASRIVSRAVRETLRFMHNRKQLATVKREGDIALASAPEALTLVWHSEKPRPLTFLYPDPPLGRRELGNLKALGSDVSFTTPLTRLAARSLPPHVTAVAVSISNSGDLSRHGLAPAHQDTLSDEIHLYLLLAGLRIAYGGALNGDFSKGSNFTLRLFQLVDNYFQLAKDVGGKMHPILNFAPWPLRLIYGDREYNLFRDVAKLIEGPTPSAAEVPEPLDQLFPSGEGFRFKSVTPEQRLAWTRGLTAMRKQMTDAVQARIVIGGKREGFSGLYPGIVEEAWMSLVNKQPLYIVSAFGGAGYALCRALDGDGTALQASFDSVADRDRVVEMARERGLEIVARADELDPQTTQFDKLLVTGDKMVQDFVNVAEEGGVSSALRNGLTEDENRELFRCTHAPRIAELILEGINRTSV